MAIIKRKSAVKPDPNSESDTSIETTSTGKYIDKIVKNGVEYEIHAANGGGETSKPKEFLCWDEIEDNGTIRHGFFDNIGEDETLPITIVHQWYKNQFRSKRKTSSHGIWKGKRTFGTYSRNKYLKQDILYNVTTNTPEWRKDQGLTANDVDIAYKIIQHFINETNVSMEHTYFDNLRAITASDLFDLLLPRQKTFTKEFIDELYRKNQTLNWKYYEGDEENQVTGTQLYIADVIEMPGWMDCEMGIGSANPTSHRHSIQDYNRLSVKFIKNCTVGEDPKWMGGQWSSWSLLMKWKLVTDDNDNHTYLVIAVSPQKVKTLAEQEIAEPLLTKIVKQQLQPKN